MSKNLENALKLIEEAKKLIELEKASNSMAINGKSKALKALDEAASAAKWIGKLESNSYLHMIDKWHESEYDLDAVKEYF